MDLHDLSRRMCSLARLVHPCSVTFHRSVPSRWPTRYTSCGRAYFVPVLEVRTAPRVIHREGCGRSWGLHGALSNLPSGWISLMGRIEVGLFWGSLVELTARPHPVGSLFVAAMLSMPTDPGKWSVMARVSLRRSTTRQSRFEPSCNWPRGSCRCLPW
jgi:hypothetical protein